MIDAGMGELRCELCGFTSYFSLISHISRKHDITLPVYRTKFPNCVVQQTSPTQRQKNHDSQMKVLEDPIKLKMYRDKRPTFPSEIKHWLNKGLSYDEACLCVSKFQSEQSHKWTSETREKMSSRISGKNNPMSLESIAKRNDVSINDAHELTPCFGRTGDKHPMFGKHHTQESLEKIAAAPHLQNPSFRSKPEIELEEYCRKISNDVKRNVKISRWNVDILFEDKKLIIEMFGDYWHMNPRRYSSESQHNLFKCTAADIWNRDNRKVLDMQERGYDIIIIWEYDWRKDQQSCIQRIKDAYDRI